MKILIQQVTITDPSSPFNGTKQDILIESGVIRDIQPAISVEADKVITGNQLHLSPGWVDVFAHFADPGYEFKETLETGARAAAAGGYTDVFVIPNTKPVVDSKTQAEYISQKSRSLPVTVHPIGAISKGAEGKDLAEMYDMRSSGAVAFSDGLNPIQSAGLLLKALQYVKAFDGTVIQIPDDKSIGANGLMHEGIVSTRLGLPGKPMMAEELQVARDIKLVRYADSKLHFTGVTAPKSLEYIRRAKDAGLAVTCSVTPYHLFFSDEDLLEYDTNLKVYPPLRTKSDVEILRQAVLDGTVDCIATHHLPHEYDSKVLEFEYAKYGMTGLETSYSAVKTALPGITESRWVELVSINPRKIFGLECPVVKKDATACFTLFDPGVPVTFTTASFRSMSKNSAFINRALQGAVKGIINKETLLLN
ncbi:dihydroorotase [Niastella yeongjuensis]|uniref:Dihydroorotase n=1 Tax=Niastella yeongjuensis TaxID=354355 RepID=A0A1V9EF50_9BACT|nr:dihydroorotase [Niastella yeongjuensis]OQP44746.1 dihydroorotase [Niastella yeongjuensis]SEO76948.1 dihydroorotase [Niastella yeongjuensis]